MKYLVEECYEEDYNPYTAETWRDNYCHEYSFAEWYFKYRRRWHNPKKMNIQKKITNKYSHTSEKLIIGGDIIETGFILL
jgi:hypothetical protein